MTDQELYDYIIAATSHIRSHTGCAISIVAYDEERHVMVSASSATVEQNIAMLEAAVEVQHQEVAGVN